MSQADTKGTRPVLEVGVDGPCPELPGFSRPCTQNNMRATTIQIRGLAYTPYTKHGQRFLLIPYTGMDFLVRKLWSSRDIRDKSPGFPSFNMHLDGKRDPGACSDIIAHSSQSALSLPMINGLPTAAGQSAVW